MLIVEQTQSQTIRNSLAIRTRPPEPVQYPICSSTKMSPQLNSTRISFKFLKRKTTLSSPLHLASSTSYSYFDVNKIVSPSDFCHKKMNEIQILLCKSSKANLNILKINNSGQIETKTIKTKLSNKLSWIVQGPKLALWDENQVTLLSKLFIKHFI